MKSLLFMFTLLTVGFPDAEAGKLKRLKTEIKNECGNINIPRQELINLLRLAYLGCPPNSKVRVAQTCEISCLKKNKGNVLGEKN